MDAETRELGAKLREKPSKEAADWILQKFPRDVQGWGNALTLIDHLSFARPDVRRLAECYLSRLPHASGRAYQVFAKKLRTEDFVAVLAAHLPSEPAQQGLLAYHLKGVQGSPKLNEQLEAFIADLGA